jgi:hypothetical protein
LIGLTEAFKFGPEGVGLGPAMMGPINSVHKAKNARGLNVMTAAFGGVGTNSTPPLYRKIAECKSRIHPSQTRFLSFFKPPKLPKNPAVHLFFSVSLG